MVYTHLSVADITNLYLYGSITRPLSLATDAILRPHDLDVRIQVDVNYYMTQGAGRFALGAQFEIVQKFFASTSLAPNTASDPYYTKEELDTLLGLGGSYGLSIQQYNYSDGTDDYRERVYIYNSTAFQLSDDVRFIVAADGTKRIENFAVSPRDDVQENFDFASSDGLAEFFNADLEYKIDQSGIGITVNIDFSGAISTSTYTLSDYNADLQIKAGWSWFPQVQLPTLLSIPTELYLDGVTSFSSEGMGIVYGSPHEDTLIDARDLRDHAYLEGHALQNGIKYFLGAGDDYVAPGWTGHSARFHVDGGAGLDTADFTSTEQTLRGRGGVELVVVGVEHVLGSSYGDTIVVQDGPGGAEIFAGAGDDVVASQDPGADIYLGAGNDTVLEAATGTRVWGGQGSDVIVHGGNVILMDADADDGIYLAGRLLTGGIHWIGSASPYAMPLTPFVGFGRNHEGDLVIRDMVTKSEMYIDRYVGGPGAALNMAGLYVAESEIGFYRLFEERPAHLTWLGGCEVFLGALLKANFGASMWSTVDPLVLDLDGDGLELSGESYGELVFDVDADGYGERSGWVGPDDGLLVLDANGDGLVKDVGELFGGPGASGFAELATHDANADGSISSADAVFANLRVWRDLDQDRVVDAGELKTLGEAGVASISLTGTPSSATINTNQIVATGTFTRVGGGTGTVADVAFRSDNQNTVFMGDRSISSAAQALPELKGYGTLTDLRVAMTLDPGLQAVVSANLPNLATLDLAALRTAVLPILTAWAEAAPVTGRPPLSPHDSVPLLIQVTDGLETVADFAYQPAGMNYWRLASGTAIKDAQGNVIAEPTLQQVQADANLEGTWSSLGGDIIAFFERYFGEEIPLDGAPSNAAQVLSQMTAVLEGLWTGLNSMAVRLAMQGPLASFFPGLRYDVAEDTFVATTPRQLIPTFEAVFNEAKGLGGAGLARLEAWERVLDIVIADYRQPDGLLNTHGFLFSNIVAAYESTGLTLGIVSVAEALGLPADLVRTGSGAVAGGEDADLFYLSAGNQTLSGGLGPDTYVVGRNNGQDVIDDFEGDHAPHSEDVIRFADIASTEVTARREGLDLVLSVNGTSDEVRVKDHFDGRLPGLSGGGDLSDSTGVDFIVFADGVTWTPFDVARAVARPEAGAQTLGGTATVDWLDGGGGDDSLSGGNDADVYVYGRGYGNDVINDAADHIHLEGPDILLFKPGVSVDDVIFRRDGSTDNLIIEIAGESGSLKLIDQFAKTYAGSLGEHWINLVESFRFDDGRALSWQDVMARVTAASGTTGDDTIYGFSVPDDLSGGAGNDYLSGGNENDTYRYTLGDGHDVVEENPDNFLGGMTDRVVFGAGITPGAVTIQRVVGTDHVKFTFSDGGSLVVRGQFSTTATGPFGNIWFDRVEQFAFQDGTSWTAEQVMAQVLTSAKTTGADTIEGYWRQDRIDGGAGNDLLIGNEESDTYIFGRGHGHDTVDDGAPNIFQTTDQDRVELANDIAVADIVLERSGTSDDLTLRIAGTDDRLTLKAQNNWFGLSRIEEVRFADGTVWSAAFLRTEFIARAQTAGGDTIAGFFTADTIQGGAGDDRLQGLAGSDRYVFNSGDGADSIYEGYETSNVDRLVLGAGLTTANLTVIRSTTDDDDVTLSFGSGGSIFIDGQFQRNGSGEGIEEIVFGDGTVWTKLDLLNATAGATPGDDTILGGAGSDTLAGAAGNDRLEGLAGADRYNFNSGDGADQIYEGYDSAPVDRLVLGAGLNPTALTIIRSTTDLDDVTLSFGSAGSIFIDGQFERNSNLFGIEEIQFGDGTIWTKLQLLNAYIALNQTSGHDTVYGGAGADTLQGGAGNDRLGGLDAGDRYVFNSGDGADSIYEGYETDDTDRLVLGAGLTVANLTVTRSTSDTNDVTLSFGSAGSIFLDGQFARNGAGEGVEEIVFGDGTMWTKLDLLSASYGATPGDDTILGGAGADTLAGGGGNDRLEGLGGADTYLFNTGEGTDKVYEGYYTSNVDRLVLGTGLNPAGLTIVRSTTDLDDVTLNFGSAGSIFIDEQFDRNDSANGVEQIQFGDGTVWSKLDLLNAYIAQQQTSGNDTIYGGAGADTLAGLAGDDRLEGLGGGDRYVFESGQGADKIYEGYETSDVDRLLLGAGLTSTNVTLVRTSADTDDITLNFGANGSVFIDEQFERNTSSYGIEEVQFGDGAVWTKTDLLQAYLTQARTSGADTIWGGAGDDTISGLGGDDRLEGQGGADRYLFNGGDGNDKIYEENASSATDRLAFGAGLSSTSVTFLRTSSDWDDVTLSFGGSGSVFIDEEFGYTGANIGIEEFIFGDSVTWTKVDLRAAYIAQSQTSGNDNFAGFGTNDVLAGGDGADTITGLEGTDTITGGAGIDRLTGGSGADRFVYAATGDAVAGGSSEIITDFSQGSDKIDLSGIDADTGTGGDQAFSFIGTAAFSNVAGQLRYATTPSGSRTIYGDVNGDGVTDFQLQLTGSITLAAGDFIL
jgi:Ca2+-binding RTX toxin-like protein